jgi:anionic cell wall polymer biosynthesis LytR-Cps2A-Psr (LCP) family protein
VDFTQFAKIVDLLGGIDIELTSAEVANLYNDYGFSLHAGVNHLNGEQALGYSRIRHIGTDFGRTNRQRIVLMTLFEKFRESSTTQLISVLSEVLELITTDMTDQEILSYAMELAPMLREFEIVSQSIPVEGSYTFGDVSNRNIVDCIFIDFEINRKILQETLAG